MIRGCQRRIYYVKNPGSKIFDEAYFVLRRDYASGEVTREAERELSDEAKRIADQASPPSPRSRRRDRLLAFAAGAAAAAAVIAAAVLMSMR